MAISFKHAKTSAKSDGADTSLVLPSDWNAEHAITCATDVVLGRSSAGTGAVQEIVCTAAGRALIDDANAAAQLVTLGAADATVNASYRTILDCTASHTAAKVAGTYAMGQGDPLAVSGTGTLYPINIISIKSADFPTVNGLSPKLRIRGQIAVNDVAPTGNFTFGLYPVTRPATSGGAGLVIYTLGTVVTGSTGATVSAPAADAHSDLVGSDFALPADGLYCIGVVTTGTIATSSHLHLSAQLQMRNA